MAEALSAPTSEFEKLDRCGDLDHRPRVLLGKMGLDGHDRGVKVIARALRDSGAHVIYSGLWQTPSSLAISARDEDADVIAASMMSNSHLVLGPRLVAARAAVGRPDLEIHMGGILPQEDIPVLLKSGIARCFTTGTGLLDIVEAARSATKPYSTEIDTGDTNPTAAATARLSRRLSLVHEGRDPGDAARARPTRVIGITGAPGAGKSTLVAQLVSEYSRRAESDPSLGRCAVIAYDPMSPITGGALLGDRLRVDFNNLGEKVFYRSLAIRGEDYASLGTSLELIGGAFASEGDGADAYQTVFVETVGAGQNETKIRDHVDRTAVVLTPGMGDSVQMDKAGILEIADLYVCNKADHAGENELVRDLRDVAGKRPILETIATRAKGVPELLDELLK
jgi:methylmalonyl-CoA mutase cobalamin-binding domain/chain